MMVTSRYIAAAQFPMISLLLALEVRPRLVYNYIQMNSCSAIPPLIGHVWLALAGFYDIGLSPTI